MITASETPLRRFRLALSDGKKKVSQERVARLADTTLQTYRSAESGEEIYLSTALAIYSAINQLRRERGLEPVSFEDLWLDRLSEVKPAA